MRRVLTLSLGLAAALGCATVTPTASAGDVKVRIGVGVGFSSGYHHGYHYGHSYRYSYSHYPRYRSHCLPYRSYYGHHHDYPRHYGYDTRFRFGVHSRHSSFDVSGPLYRPPVVVRERVIVTDGLSDARYLPGARLERQAAVAPVEPIDPLAGTWDLLKSGDHAAAMRRFDKLAEADPMNPQLKVGYALAAVQAGYPQQARRGMERAMLVAPGGLSAELLPEFARSQARTLADQYTGSKSHAELASMLERVADPVEPAPAADTVEVKESDTSGEHDPI